MVLGDCVATLLNAACPALAGYNCASPIVPENGVVTDPADWDATTSRWGSGGTLIGNTFYFGGGAASITARREEAPSAST
jgi:hypothetical protein